MSGFMKSVLRIVHGNKDGERLRHGKINSRRRRPRDRSLQYADSFIFVPGEINSTANNDVNQCSPRIRAITFADNISSSALQQPPAVVNGGAVSVVPNYPLGLGKTIKFRISQEVEDKHFHDERQEPQSFTVEQRHTDPSSLIVPYPYPNEPASYEIECPPGERYCNIRPYSYSSISEYTKPTDCIRPTVNSWHHANDSDLESIDEGRYGGIDSTMMHAGQKPKMVNYNTNNNV